MKRVLIFEGESSAIAPLKKIIEKAYYYSKAI